MKHREMGDELYWEMFSTVKWESGGWEKQKFLGREIEAVAVSTESPRMEDLQVGEKTQKIQKVETKDQKNWQSLEDA